MKELLIAAILGVISGVSYAQNTQQQYVTKEVRQAKAGESCAASYSSCGGWCDQNKAGISDKNACKQSCSEYQGICVKTGIWSTPLGKVEIRGLPPR